jgi:hypothetical protein
VDPPGWLVALRATSGVDREAVSKWEPLLGAPCDKVAPEDDEGATASGRLRSTLHGAESMCDAQ